MKGIVGRFMSSFGFTAAFAIAVSLLVSFTLTPMLCSRFIKPRIGGHADSKESVIFRVAGPLLHAHAALGHGASRGDGRAERSGDYQHRSAVHVRGQELFAG